MACPLPLRSVTLLAMLFLHIDFGYAQQKYFMGLPVDTVDISSSSGSYHLDHAGTTTGVQDSYRIIFDKESRKYFTQYKRTHIKFTIEPETAEYKEGRVHTAAFDDQSNLDSLFIALSVRYKALSIDQLGLSEPEIKELISNKRIIRVAANYKEDGQFKRKYATKDRNEQLFDACRNMDTLKLFLATFKVDTSNRFLIVSDYWDEMHIRVICNDSVFSFEGKYPNPLKLPWYFRSNSMYVRPVFNFDINKYLAAVLPSYFYRKHTIRTEALLNAYIVWYLHRRGIIMEEYRF